MTSALSGADQFTIEPPTETNQKDFISPELPPLADAMKALDMETVLHTGKMATRRAYGVALRTLGGISPDVVVLDADVSNSTFAESFAKDARLADRFVEC